VDRSTGQPVKTVQWTVLSDERPEHKRRAGARRNQQSPTGDCSTNAAAPKRSEGARPGPQPLGRGICRPSGV